ncbi:hypothetical protein GCM10009624_24000 [Gordonia sinesedis]
MWSGAYVRRGPVPPTPIELHRLAAIAASRAGNADLALSGVSAAALHGLSLLDPPLERVHFTTGFATGGRIEKRRHLHSGPLDPADVTAVDGVPVTTLERTAVDVACASTFPAALAVFDSALRLGADPEVLADALDGCRRGVAVGRRALAHADPGAENAGESWGRAQIIDDGLPVPRLQYEFFDADGVFIARTDYDWDGKLAAEFDGMAKYQRHLRPGETPFDAMRREKFREDGLRRLGTMVLRWVWADLRAHRVAPMVAEWLGRLGMVA